MFWDTIGLEEYLHWIKNQKTRKIQNTSATKTVYDPSKISNETYIKRGMEVVKNTEPFPEGTYKGYGLW